MKRASWIVTLPVTLAVVVFAVANRDAVVVSLWPSDASLEVPLFILVLGGVLVGFLAGATVMWLSASKGRNRARRSRYRAEELERELSRLRRQAEAARSAPPETLDTPRLAIGNGKSRDMPPELRN